VISQSINVFAVLNEGMYASWTRGNSIVLSADQNLKKRKRTALITEDRISSLIEIIQVGDLLGINMYKIVIISCYFLIP
jgi:hypothetical protein